MKAPLPPNERERLAALRRLEILDTPAEERFDRITRVTHQIGDTPIVLVSLVDASRQWFKSKVGLDGLETPREHAFCAHAILSPELMVVPDALEDSRFLDNPLVTGGPRIRFYAGAPLVLEAGVQLGTLCVIDTRPRLLHAAQAKALIDLSHTVVDELVLRRQAIDLDAVKAQLDRCTAELRYSNQGLTQFAHTASHDLRAPLKTLINLADLALLDPGESVREILERMRMTAHGMEEIVAGYLRLSKLQLAEAQNVALAELVHDAGRRRAVRVESKLDRDHTLTCDPGLMRQVFVNLIENAEKYSSSGVVRIDSVATEEAVTVRVSNAVARDIPVDRSIFVPFRQLTAGVPGTGLGLAIVDRVVALHGGTVTASCENRRFTVEMSFPRTRGPS